MGLMGVLSGMAKREAGGGPGGSSSSASDSGSSWMGSGLSSGLLSRPMSIVTGGGADFTDGGGRDESRPKSMVTGGPDGAFGPSRPITIVTGGADGGFGLSRPINIVTGGPWAEVEDAAPRLGRLIIDCGTPILFFLSSSFGRGGKMLRGEPCDGVEITD